MGMGSEPPTRGNGNDETPRELPNTVDRAKVIAHNIVEIPKWASFTSLSDPTKKLVYPKLRQCARLPGHGRSLTPIDPSTISGISDTASFKGMLFSYPIFQYDNELHHEVLPWGLLRRTELDSHKNILSIFSKHGLPVEKIIDQYSLDNISIIDRVTKEYRILSEKEFIARLRLEFTCIVDQEVPKDGFRIIGNPGDFAGRASAVRKFLKELEHEHPFVVAEREMPHNVRLTNISSVFEAQFPKQERKERFVEILREALEYFPWRKFPLLSNLPVITSIPESIGKPDSEFLRWYAEEFIPIVLGTYLRTLHSFATHGWVTPQNITIVGIPTDLDSVHGPEITGDPVDPKRVLKDHSDAQTSLHILCRAISPRSVTAARANFQRAYGDV